jgi:hypothetical protein
VTAFAWINSTFVGEQRDVQGLSRVCVCVRERESARARARERASERSTSRVGGRMVAYVRQEVATNRSDTVMTLHGFIAVN